MISSSNFQLRVQCIPPDGATAMSSHVYHGPLQIGTLPLAPWAKVPRDRVARCGGDLAKARLKKGVKTGEMVKGWICVGILKPYKCVKYLSNLTRNSLTYHWCMQTMNNQSESNA